MHLSLLPRVRVNYTFWDLLKALFIGNKRNNLRKACRQILTDYYGSNVLLVPSSRDAIFELLVRLPQKKVIVPSYTCMVVNEAVLLSGKEFVYAKSDLDVFNSSYLEYIDSDSIVLATHQYGIPCNIKEIMIKCKETGAVLIEDCATSMGTIVEGQLTGTFGDYALISFNQSKTLNVPPFGGVLIGKDSSMLRDIEQTSEWCDTGWKFKLKGLAKGFAFVLSKNSFVYKFMHWATIDRKGKLQRTEHEEVAKEKTAFYKFRFTEWQASILLTQLRKMDKIFEKRKLVYAFYNEHIVNPFLVKPVYNPYAVCTRYVVLNNNRNTFYKKCVAKGIDMDFSHCNIGCPLSFKQEHNIAHSILNLPFYYDMSEKEMNKVVEVVNSIR